MFRSDFIGHPQGVLCDMHRSLQLICYEFPHITLDNKFQNKFYICDEYVINLFVYSYEVRKGT